jgi:hypothetical protein
VSARHTGCEHDMHAVVVCDEPLDVRQTRATAGPGYRPLAAEAAR